MDAQSCESCDAMTAAPSGYGRNGVDSGAIAVASLIRRSMLHLMPAWSRGRGTPVVSALLVLVACGSRSGIDEGAGADRRTERLRTGGEGNGAPVIPRRCVEDWQTLYEDDSPWFALQPALALAGQELLFS